MDKPSHVRSLVRIGVPGSSPSAYVAFQRAHLDFRRNAKECWTVPSDIGHYATISVDLARCMQSLSLSLLQMLCP